VASASAALATLGESPEHVIVHFDVDSIDSRDLPLGNFPHYGTGVTLAVARDALTTFYQAPMLAAAILTEVNPSYDPSGVSLSRYSDPVAGALISGLGRETPFTA